MSPWQSEQCGEFREASIHARLISVVGHVLIVEVSPGANGTRLENYEKKNENEKSTFLSIDKA